jgi:hypothetical protein
MQTEANTFEGVPVAANLSQPTKIPEDRKGGARNVLLKRVMIEVVGSKTSTPSTTTPPKRGQVFTTLEAGLSAQRVFSLSQPFSSAA